MSDLDLNDILGDISSDEGGSDAGGADIGDLLGVDSDSDGARSQDKDAAGAAQTASEVPAAKQAVPAVGSAVSALTEVVPESPSSSAAGAVDIGDLLGSDSDSDGARSQDEDAAGAAQTAIEVP
eukprot:CAMPEP_0115171626 /NCGR_PEP_ID=MMETSP0270-20121206/2400_1 /TAXON_ID=71861 /ORGANISM="Scrippsiella trochoidea, Strain CCMP3099" /LENGTH=123 /DNA_ID=CAMNT_0002584399 /DNA_START=159 /DNA_END=527 /DNA_ORIENTATION=-